MAKRESISKKTRFEVFKRDKFQCQYCGAVAPDVVLEIDHINPIANGGDNSILNLVTACYDCNRGKGSKELSDDSVLRVQGEQLRILSEKREQQEMMLEWKLELIAFADTQVDVIDALIEKITEYGLTEHGRMKIKRLLERFDLTEVYEATEIAYDQYYHADSDWAWNKAFSKIGGICYNRKHGR